jgi:hypothetical protein
MVSFLMLYFEVIHTMHYIHKTATMISAVYLYFELYKGLDFFTITCL